LEYTGFGVHYLKIVLSHGPVWATGLEVSMLEGLFQPMHLLIIFAIALLVFGPRKLPELGKGLGEGIRALKNGMKDNETKPEVKTDGKPENKA
jgi:sec-independent protein translocase protein TatA